MQDKVLHGPGIVDKLQGQTGKLWINQKDTQESTHIPRIHTQHLGVDSAQVEAAVDASSKGMWSLLLAVTAAFPISSDACSLQERLEQPGN